MKFEYVEYNRKPSDDELLDDIKRVSNEVDPPLSSNKYKAYGMFDVSTISRRFGSWIHALELAGVEADVSNRKHSKEDLFSNIERAWIMKGKQPVRNDMNDKSISSISSGAYLRSFGTWNNALQSFIAYVNENNEDIVPESTLRTSRQNGSRDINLRLRFRVMQRDNFKCCACGASPAKDPAVVLHVDHIVPWAKGGETTFDNLQTLCSDCNLGKSDLLLDENT